MREPTYRFRQRGALTASRMLLNVISRPGGDPSSLVDHGVGGMAAVQEAIGQQPQRGLRRLIKRPGCWPLLAMPRSLIVYVIAILACDLALIAWALAHTPLRPGNLALFAALLAAAVLCVEALRRLG